MPAWIGALSYRASRSSGTNTKHGRTRVTTVGQGLRADLEQPGKDPLTVLVESLKRHGVSEEVLQEALAEVIQR